MNTNPKSGTGGRLTSTEKRRREQASPIIKLVKLLSKTFQQPLGLPTPDQAAEMNRLNLEVETLTKYRATHPNWRQERLWS